MGQSSVFATSAIKRSLSSCSIVHSSNMCSDLLTTVPTWAGWGVNYFKPVEVRFDVPVARVRMYVCPYVCMP